MRLDSADCGGFEYVLADAQLPVIVAGRALASWGLPSPYASQHRSILAEEDGIGWEKEEVRSSQEILCRKTRESLLVMVLHAKATKLAQADIVTSDLRRPTSLFSISLQDKTSSRPIVVG